MLTADQLDALTDPIVDLYERYQQSVINDIARRLGKMGGMTETAAWQMQRLIESGALYENALEEIARLTGQSEAVLRETFQKAGVQAMRFDDAIYRAAGLNPLPLNLSPAMAEVLAAGLAKTGGIMKNLTMTTASAAQDAFISAADLAYMQVSTGAMSYTEAIRDAIKGVAANGLNVVTYAGRRDQLDVAMRRTVLTGVNQTTGKLQEARANELGVDLVQTTAHIGARPEHQVWQGQVFSRSGMDKRYPPFVESTGYGTGPGLMGWNCRHNFYPFFEGISENAYSEADRQSFSSKTVTYNGKEMSYYDATQQQRYIERKIRYWKRQESALSAGGQERELETNKVREWQGRMREFTRQTGLQRQRDRERIFGVGAPPKAAAVPPKPVVPPLAPAPTSGASSRQGSRELTNIKVSDAEEPGKRNNLFSIHPIEDDVIYDSPIDLSTYYAGKQIKADRIVFPTRQKVYIFRGHRDDLIWASENQDLVLQAITQPEYLDIIPRRGDRSALNIAHVISIGDDQFLNIVIRFFPNNPEVAHLFNLFRARKEYIFLHGELRPRWMKIR